jgi:hypothetical protein
MFPLSSPSSLKARPKPGQTTFSRGTPTRSRCREGQDSTVGLTHRGVAQSIDAMFFAMVLALFAFFVFQMTQTPARTILQRINAQATKQIRQLSEYWNLISSFVFSMVEERS